MPKDFETGIDLKAAFREGDRPKPEAQTPKVPESIKRHAPAPSLRPDGSWRARADEVDRLVREQEEAQKAKSKWAARTEAQQAEKLGSKFRRSAR